ncbi:glycoside hydrolase family 15 protein [Pelagibius marinus]|uniref:glycoside hydrolase family 15 protein n=1 Tax=Pelagibius marinus TaxID=2762760 RepID=UPI00187249D5|nr:glycoside hydrolase family 15 protein [Pelagibius marinus]
MDYSADLEAWVEKQAHISAAAMERAISATGLIRRRRVFGQVVVPAPGSVLASPVIADWDPEPDYFFHWVRDSAIVMRTVADLMAAATSGSERDRWRRHFENFVRFSLQLCSLDGGAFLAASHHRQATQRDWKKHLRPDAEIRRLSGDSLLGEPRFNADGTLDVLRWSRPQYDGPALRALACLTYLAAGAQPDADLRRLLDIDLRFTLRHADLPCIGPWEEFGQQAHHYYVALVQLAALVHGGDRAGDAAEEWEAAEDRLRAGLAQHWSSRCSVYAAIRDAPGESAEDLVDAAQLLAVLDADLPGGPHSVQDPRVQATQAALEQLFARDFPINHDLPPGRAPALGRSRADRYFGGGAWYPTTLAAAALNYRLALCPGQDRAALLDRGDAFMATVRHLTPEDGELSEQVDRETGSQTSARHLTWSYAAFLGAARLRDKAKEARSPTLPAAGSRSPGG